MTIINQGTLEKSQNPNQDESDQLLKEEETFTCEICIEPVTLPNSEFKNSNRCIHPFCTDCMIKYIQVKLEDNVSDIKCPASTCDHSLDPLSCHPKLTQQLFNKWSDVLCESTVLEVDRAYCPNMECSGLILNECGDGNNLKRCECPYCKKPFCFKCKVSWHVGYSCNKTQDISDVAFHIISESQGWKKCPKCSHCVERTWGCDTITCRCGYKFCYRCGKHMCRHGHRGEFLIWSVICSIVVFIAVLLIVGSTAIANKLHWS